MLRRLFRFSSGFVLPFIVHPTLGCIVYKHGHRHDDDDQNQDQGGGIAGVEVLEAFLIKVEQVEVGGFQGTAFGDDVGFGEDLEGLDHLDDELEEERWSEQGDGDLEENPQLAGSIDSCRLVQLRRDVLQACQIDDCASSHLP